MTRRGDGGLLAEKTEETGDISASLSAGIVDKKVTVRLFRPLRILRIG